MTVCAISDPLFGTSANGDGTKQWHKQACFDY